MALIQVHDQQFDIDAIIFDKDGTLIDMHHFWGRVAESWCAQLLSSTGADAKLQTALYATLGYDADNRHVIPDTPLAAASMWKLFNLMAVVLFQHGVDWHEAEKLTAQLEADFHSLLQPDFIKPLGDVAGTCQRLADAGIRLAIATSDDRATTEWTLPILGIDTLIEAMACGDDPFPNKPAADGLLHICNQLGIAPQRMLMVGDSISDIDAGRNAGVSACIGVVEVGGDSADSVATVADVCVLSIEQFAV